MRKIIYCLSTLVLTIGLLSCNIESEMYDNINYGEFPKNEEDAKTLVVAAAYGPFRTDGYSGIFNSAYGGIHVATEMTTDLGQCQWDDAVWPDLINVNFTPNSAGLATFYNTYKKSISAITVTFGRIKDISMKEESTRELLNAELTFGRAWLTFLLYDLYGPIPVASPEHLSDPMNDTPVARPTQEWMVNFIETELKEAIKVLPTTYKSSSSDYGRYTKGIAYTVLMKLYMHEKEWAKAMEVGRELMKPEYGYKLVDDYKDIFTLENERNSEIIWACQNTRSTNMQSWLAHVLSSQYPTKNPNIQKWGGYRVPWEFYNTFDKQKDKRLEVLVGDFKYIEKGKEITCNEANPGTILIKGAMPIKYGEDPVATGSESQIDWVVYRYADILTMLSEATARAANATTQESVDLLNTIRTRAGIDTYTLSDFANVDDFLDKVLLNRGQEFWFEGIRRSDLIRHGKYVEYVRAAKNSKTVKKEFELFPIPQSAIDEGKGVIIQNPGY